MGLDITYYQNIRHIPCVFNADGEPIGVPDNHFRVYVNPAFPERAKGLEDKAVYTYDKCEGFRAGSYSGYNQWREELAKLAGYPRKDDDRHGNGHIQRRHDAGAWAATEGPFWELINFSDCEGTIGPEVCAKLAKDFADHQEKANQHPDDYWRSRYEEWRSAFETAAQNGAVDFH